jgi:hypothetical protein
MFVSMQDATIVTVRRPTLERLQEFKATRDDTADSILNDLTDEFPSRAFREDIERRIKFGVCESWDDVRRRNKL